MLSKGGKYMGKNNNSNNSKNIKIGKNFYKLYKDWNKTFGNYFNPAFCQIISKFINIILMKLNIL
jgi:hypothetical protein